MWREILMAGMVAAGGAGAGTRVLLLVNDRFGATGQAGMEGRPRIAETFESFGWQVDGASPRGQARPCDFAAKAGRAPVTVQKTVEIASVEAYDAVVLEPDAFPEDLAGDPASLALLRDAKRRNRVIAAFGRGVTVLAAADVIAGHRVVGHPEDVETLRAAGAASVGFGDLGGKSDVPPPILDGNLVTGGSSHSFRGLMCDAIRIAVENGRVACGPTARPSARNALFAFPLESGGERAAVLLAESLRRNGGALARSTLVAVVERGVMVAEGVRSRLLALGVEFVPQGTDPGLAGIPLAEKAEAAAAAEAHALDHKAEVLVWLDRDSYLLREPSEFLLPEGATLAFRPVHHRRIGSRAVEPLDSFWTAIFSHLGVDPAMAFPVVSTIDRERIRFYPNAGCLAVRPGAGLMAAWREALVEVARSGGLSALTGGDPVKSLFLHQAVLAATILKRVPRSAIRELSFVYNYPLHLHGKTPPDLRPGRLEDLVTVRYERMDILESALPMGEATRRELAGQ